MRARRARVRPRGSVRRRRRTMGSSARLGQQPREFIRHTEHRIMPGVQFEPCGPQTGCGAPLVRLTRVDRLAAPDHCRLPALIPEVG